MFYLGIERSHSAIANYTSLLRQKITNYQKDRQIL
jgi:hypothetical protein